MRLRTLIKEQDTVILYGAGAIGQKTEKWLHKKHIRNFCFAVSCEPDRRVSDDGTDIYAIEELVEEHKGTLVLITTLYSFQKEIIRHLANLGFTNVVPLDDAMLYEIGIYQIYGFYIQKHITLFGVTDKLCKKIWRNAKCKNVLMFESRMDYTDSARALSEYIEKQMPRKYKKVWVVQNKHRRCVDNTVWIKRKDPSLMDVICMNYYVAHARYIFLTHPGWLQKSKDGQKIVQLGHGEPFKSPVIHDVGIDSRNLYADYVLASSEDGALYRKLEYGNAVQNVIVYGPPRNDWLYCGKAAISKYFDSTSFDKVVLCLPTFKRANFSSGAIGRVISESVEDDKYGISIVKNKEELKRLNSFLNQKKILLLCKDHFIEIKKTYEDTSTIKYLTNEMLEKNGHDMTELLSGADALVTDFSSVFMDFLLLDRPVGFFVENTESYTRGFAVKEPAKYMAGHMIHTLEDFFLFLDDVKTEYDNYVEDRKLARDLVHKYQDGNNCKRLVDFLSL